jgi:hypothetical protein
VVTFENRLTILKKKTMDKDTTKKVTELNEKKGRRNNQGESKKKLP